jgi:hypothetical protein
VANAVVAGHSAEPLLDALCDGVSAQPPAVQLQPRLELELPHPPIGYRPQWSLAPQLDLGIWSPFVAPPPLTLMERLAAIVREGEVLSELSELASASLVPFPPSMFKAPDGRDNGWTQERADTAVQVFIASARALWALDLPESNAVILAGKANAETGLVRGNPNNPNPAQNNWFSFQPNEANRQVTALKDVYGMTDQDFAGETRDNGPGNPTGTLSPHFRSMYEGIKSYVQIFLGVQAPSYVTPAAPGLGKLLANPNLSIAQYALSDASSGTFGGPLKDANAQSERVRVLTNNMTAPKKFIVYWLTHMPPTASPAAREWAAARASEIGNK